MGVTVNASIGTEKYYTKVTAGENSIITDEPVDKGGGNKGLNPFELLAASLATCTAATLRMYIDRKEWSVPEINVEVFVENYPRTETTVFERKINYEGAELTEEQRDRLVKIAEKCPIHKLLHYDMEIKTNFV